MRLASLHERIQEEIALAHRAFVESAQAAAECVRQLKEILTELTGFLSRVQAEEAAAAPAPVEALAELVVRPAHNSGVERAPMAHRVPDAEPEPGEDVVPIAPPAQPDAFEEVHRTRDMARGKSKLGKSLDDGSKGEPEKDVPEQDSPGPEAPAVEPPADEPGYSDEARWWFQNRGSLMR
jgi:hypothetical protein